MDVPCTQVGEKVDARDLSMGAWFEAQVARATTETTLIIVEDSFTLSGETEPTIFYHVKFDE